MSDHDTASGGEPASPSTDPSKPAHTWRYGWLVPAVTFVLGLILGGVTIGLLQTNTATTVAQPTASASPSPEPTDSPSPSVSASEFTIPAECVQVAADAQTLLGLVDDSVAAIRDLDAAELSSIVSQLQTVSQQVRDQAATCQSVAATANSASGSAGESTFGTPSTTG